MSFSKKNSSIRLNNAKRRSSLDSPPSDPPTMKQSMPGEDTVDKSSIPRHRATAVASEQPVSAPIPVDTSVTQWGIFHCRFGAGLCLCGGIVDDNCNE